MHDQAARLATRIEAAGERPQDADAGPLSRNEWIRAYVEAFPARKGVPHGIQQIHTVADKEGIVLERCDYRRPTGEGALLPTARTISAMTIWRTARKRRSSPAI